MTVAPVASLQLFGARSRVAVDLKEPLASLPEAARARLFRDGPLHGYPLLNRLRLTEKEAHYPLEELAALILELKRIAPALAADPELAPARAAWLAAVTRARDAQRNVYVVPVRT